MSCSRFLIFVLLSGVWIACDVTRANAAVPAFVKYDGKHIHLHTNAGTKEDAEDYIAAFDAAIQQWVAFWSLPQDTVASWSVDAIVMSDRNAATIAGLMKPRIPDFKFGYASGNTLYVMSQPSPYYTEHLLLHEGVHALAQHAFGGRGPTWFMEGTAELLATHRGRGSAVRVNQVPMSREEAPFWGRLKLIRDQRDDQTIPTIETIMKAPPRLDGDIGDYTWSWAASMLLTEYPEYRQTFQAMTLAGHDSTSELTRQLYQRLSANWPALVARFRLMSHSLDYGFDWERERVAISMRDRAWTKDSLRLVVKADQGWQSAEVLFPAGARISIEASGTCALANDPKPWTSEPDGVTIRFHDGKPLGRLLACVVPVEYDRSAKILPPLDIVSVGANTVIEVKQPSWLVLRINDFACELSDNTGAYSVQVR